MKAFFRSIKSKKSKKVRLLRYIDKDGLEETAFSGKRIKRGLYRNKKGILINNDLNTGLNIIRKSKPKALRTGFKGWNTPQRTYLFG